MTKTQALAEINNLQPKRCKACDFQLFDGLIMRVRVIRVNPDQSIHGKCGRCKSWVELPLAPQQSQADLARSVFALGRFIDYRLFEGMSLEDLQPFMQSYINLSDRLEGRQPRSLHELLSQKAIDAPDLPQAIRQVGPAWLPDGEKQRLYRLAPRNDQNTNGLHESKA